jgi:hypothetical protein
LLRSGAGTVDIVAGQKLNRGQKFGVRIFQVNGSNLNVNPVLKKCIRMHQRVSYAGGEIEVAIRLPLELWLAAGKALTGP